MSNVDSSIRTCALSMSSVIVDEYMKARRKHATMRSTHEGYAVILEELDEMWDAIKADNIEEARKEAKQVAAMALAFLIEVNP